MLHLRRTSSQRKNPRRPPIRGSRQDDAQRRRGDWRLPRPMGEPRSSDHSKAYRTTNANRAGSNSSAPIHSCRVAPTGPARGGWASLAAVIIAVDELLGREPLAKHLGADRQGLIFADEVDV